MVKKFYEESVGTTLWHVFSSAKVILVRVLNQFLNVDFCLSIFCVYYSAC